MGRRRVVAALLMLCASCKAELGDGPIDASGSNGPMIDGHQSIDIDGSMVDAPLGAFGAPAKIPGADTGVDEDDSTLSTNELELFFKRNDAGDNNLYVMTRTSLTAAWSGPTAVTTLNSAQDEESPRLSWDDLTIYFGRNGEIYKSTRTTAGSQMWSSPTAVTTLNTAANEKWAAVCGTDDVIVSRANGTNGQDLYEGTLTAGAATNLSTLNSTAQDQGTFLSKDCLTIYFQSNRDNNQFDLYMATRATTTSAWGAPTKLTDFNTATYSEEDPWPGVHTFVYASNALGSKDLYMATR